MDLFGEEYFLSEDQYLLRMIEENIAYWNNDEYYEPYDFRKIAVDVQTWLTDYREVLVLW